jgi:hypothetical protein
MNCFHIQRSVVFRWIEASSLVASPTTAFCQGGPPGPHALPGNIRTVVRKLIADQAGSRYEVLAPSWGFSRD